MRKDLLAVVLADYDSNMCKGVVLILLMAACAYAMSPQDVTVS
jgi:hypothetical protein